MDAATAGRRNAGGRGTLRRSPSASTACSPRERSGSGRCSRTRAADRCDSACCRARAAAGSRSHRAGRRGTQDTGEPAEDAGLVRRLAVDAEVEALRRLEPHQVPQARRRNRRGGSGSCTAGACRGRPRAGANALDEPRAPRARRSRRSAPRCPRRGSRRAARSASSRRRPEKWRGSVGDASSTHSPSLLGVDRRARDEEDAPGPLRRAVERLEQVAQALHVGRAVERVIGAAGRRHVEDEVEIRRKVARALRRGPRSASMGRMPTGSARDAGAADPRRRGTRTAAPRPARCRRSRSRRSAPSPSTPSPASRSPRRAEGYTLRHAAAHRDPAVPRRARSLAGRPRPTSTSTSPTPAPSSRPAARPSTFRSRRMPRPSPRASTGCCFRAVTTSRPTHALPGGRSLRSRASRAARLRSAPARRRAGARASRARDLLRDAAAGAPPRRIAPLPHPDRRPGGRSASPPRARRSPRRAHRARQPAGEPRWESPRTGQQPAPPGRRRARSRPARRRARRGRADRGDRARGAGPSASACSGIRRRWRGPTASGSSAPSSPPARGV